MRSTISVVLTRPRHWPFGLGDAAVVEPNDGEPNDREPYACEPYAGPPAKVDSTP